VSDATALIAWLRAEPPDAPIERSGATAAFAAISGHPITAVMQSRGARRLTHRERQLLQSSDAITGHERRGTLYAGSIPAAATTAVLLPQRLPAAVRATLGIGPDGEALPRASDVPGAGDVPLGRALRGLGARREPLRVQCTPGEQDAAGREVVVCSAARLWLGHPVGIVTERVYREFLDAFPIGRSVR
jgi:hypothetical protein